MPITFYYNMNLENFENRFKIFIALFNIFENKKKKPVKLSLKDLDLTFLNSYRENALFKHIKRQK